MISDPAFEAWVQRARNVRVKAEIQRRGLWKRTMEGDGGVPCLKCGGTDRFAVNQRKNLFLCRKSGTSGDAIALARYLDGTTFLQAVETVTGEPPPDRASTETPEQRQKRIERLEVEARVAAQRAKEQADDAAKFRELERNAAHKIWMNGKAISGTLAEAYLRHRGIFAPPEARLRFAPSLGLYAGAEFDNRHQGRVQPVYSGPVLLAAIQAGDGHFIGVQRIWIDLDQPKGKLCWPDPASPGEFLDVKKTRGSKRGGSIRLAGHSVGAHYISNPEDFYLGEGIETVLSVYASLDPGARARGEFHAGVDLGNICGKAEGKVAHPSLTKADTKGVERRVFVASDIPKQGDDTPLIKIPASAKRLFLLGDGDSEPFATKLALRRAATRYSEAYPWLEIRIPMAAPGHDFNSMMMEGAA